MTALRHTAKGGKAPRSRDYYLDAGREYVRRYGADEMTAAAFSPAAAKRGGRPDLVERYYAGRESGEAWPSLNALKRCFNGTWNEFRAALGLPPNTTLPARGRRAPGEAEPILDVRERRVVTPDASTTWLRKQLASAERRAARLAEALDVAKEGYRVEVPVDTKTVTNLRERLQDEKSRRREIEKELVRAERRDRASAREIERLTERLAAGPRVITKTVTKRVPGKPEVKEKVRTVYVQDETLVRANERLEARVADLRGDLRASEEVREEQAERLASIRRDGIEKALRDQRVRAAEERVREVERQLAVLAEMLTGTRRILTDEEVRKLRSDGPAGEKIFIAMVKRIGRAEGTVARKAAIYDAIGAGYNWMDRL